MSATTATSNNSAGTVSPAKTTAAPVTSSSGTTSSDVSVTRIADGYLYTANRSGDVIYTAAGDKNQVFVTGTLSANILSRGNDAISLGAGADTISATGNTTVYGRYRRHDVL